MKLMKRCISLELLELLENWLSESYSCVEWGESWPHNIQDKLPVLLSVYIDDIGQLQNNLMDGREESSFGLTKFTILAYLSCVLQSSNVP